jgi:hypothetical protein
MPWLVHQGREIIAIVPLENGVFCQLFLVKVSINFWLVTVHYFFHHSGCLYFTKISKLWYNVLMNKLNESCALHCRYPSALVSLHFDKGMVMNYFKWSGVLAIRTMQCIPMLFLYYTLHLYYTPVGLLAWLIILLPYVDPVCWLRWLLSLLLLTSSSSCTAHVQQPR